MHVPGARRRGDETGRARVFRIAHIHDRKPLRHHMADIRVAAMNHNLHAVRFAALIAVANQPHIAAVLRFGKRMGCHGVACYLCLASSVANHGAIKSSDLPQPGMTLASEATLTASGLLASSACGMAAALNS